MRVRTNVATYVQLKSVAEERVVRPLRFPETAG